MTTPQRFSDRYDLGEILGLGGMSEVFLARDVRLHRDVAIKVLRADLARDPTFHVRFRREAQHAAALNHPAIVAVHDVGEATTADGALPYIVMEWVDGVTLRDVVHTEGPIEPRRAIEIIADACQALDYSHQHGIIHRDVKPANIMLNKAGAVKVMDFGIARALADSGTPVTQAGAVVGTAQYFSPEQASGETVDARSDVYSLGCVLYEILTGGPPFVGDSPVAVAYQHVRKAPAPPSARNPAVSPELDAVVLKALAKKADDRYQSAADMRADLVRVHDGRPPEAPKAAAVGKPTPIARMTGNSRTSDTMPGLPPDEPRRSKGVRRSTIAAAILAVLAVVATVAINLTSGGDVQVPAVAGKSQSEAISTLQSRGFKTDPQSRPDPSVDTGLVVDTDPPANARAESGATVTVVVSSGPEQHVVPDVRGDTPSDAISRLNDAGFDNLKQTPGASTPEQKGRVIDTIPSRNSTAAGTNQVVVVVGNGPDTIPIPAVAGQLGPSAHAVLGAAGFTNLVDVPTDDPAPAGQVIGTVPEAGQTVPGDQAVQVRISNGNQFVMPSLLGQVYDDVVPFLAGLGFRGPLLNGGSVPVTQDKDRNRVVRQDPPAGVGVGDGGTITLYYGGS